MAPAPSIERRRLRVTGTVQGVGFRPFVYRHAVELGLRGTVANDRAGVLIDVEGSPDGIAELCRRVVAHPPPLAIVDGVEATVLPPVGTAGGFSIAASSGHGVAETPVGTDTATCADCLREVQAPSDRRHRYPFTNCTNCGPRYTIVRAVPYDRAATTMAAFALCDPCRREYEDPADRRFHAQPNACPVCGPRLRHVTPAGEEVADGDDALLSAASALIDGGILAIKGLGGFHLAVDATAPAAVARLRRRKHRDDKPFAVMVADLDEAHRLCHLDQVAVDALTSPRRPIVLAPARPGSGLAPAVAPGLPEVGVLLPYTALHDLVLREVARPLVLTSGNQRDEPIAFTDEDATRRLGPLVDGIVTHDRDIHIRCDDSVVRATGGRLQVLRRSRGHAPEPLGLPAPARRHVLAVGAELKSTVAVARSGMVVASHHLGDLEHPAAFEAFEQAAEHLCRLFGVEPAVVVHDRHPEYLSTKWARDTDLPTLAVQHHHAHVASCLVEHGLTGPVLGLAFDGLGYGDDGTLWGGEFLRADLRRSERVGHLQAVGLPGGAAAIREPWRMAVSWVHHALGRAAAEQVGGGLDARAPDLLRLLDRGTCPSTTSAGRLFDAVAGLLGLRTHTTYEGQAAIELEALARRVPAAEAPAYEVDVRHDGGLAVLDPSPLVATVVAERAAGTPPAVIAAGFHEGLGRAAARLAGSLARRHGLDTVALTGGVFQNVRLTDVVVAELRQQGLRPLVHHLVPPNDGGISIGQAAIGASAGSPQVPVEPEAPEGGR